MKSSSNDICIRDGCDLFLRKVLINMPRTTLWISEYQILIPEVIYFTCTQRTFTPLWRILTITNRNANASLP